MYNPSGSESHNEFIEIYNASNQTVNLENYRISDGTASDALLHFSGRKELLPKQFAVILDGSYPENSDHYNALFPQNISLFVVDDSAIGSGGLSNSNPEKVQLIFEGSIVDDVLYQSGANNGHSYERKLFHGNRWGFSETENGSPGFQNTIDKLANRFQVTAQFVSEERNVHLKILRTEFFPKEEITFNLQIGEYQGNHHFLFTEGQSAKIELRENQTVFESVFQVTQWPLNRFVQLKMELLKNTDSLFQAKKEWLTSINRAPLYLDVIQLEKPQKIRFTNRLLSTLFIDTLFFKTRGGWKNIVMNQDVFSGEHIWVSKHDSTMKHFNPEIPFLYRESKLSFQVHEFTDSVEYNSYQIDFYDSGIELIPENETIWNDETTWIANPNKESDSFSSPQPFELVIRRNPFSPNNDGVDDQLEIFVNYNVFDVVNMWVFNLSGQKIHTFSTEPTYFGVGTWVWDGKMLSGETCIAGAYVLVFSGREKFSGKQVTKRFPVYVYR